MLEFLADVEKSLRLGLGALRGRIFLLRDGEAVVSLHHGYNQPASRDLRPCPRSRLRRQSSTVVRDTGQRKLLMNIALADVLMYPVVRDVSS